MTNQIVTKKMYDEVIEQRDVALADRDTLSKENDILRKDNSDLVLNADVEQHWSTRALRAEYRFNEATTEIASLKTLLIKHVEWKTKILSLLDTMVPAEGYCIFCGTCEENILHSGHSKDCKYVKLIELGNKLGDK